MYARCPLGSLKSLTNAIIVVVDPRVGDGNVVGSVNVPTVCKAG